MCLQLSAVHFTVIHWNVDCDISTWIFDKSNEGRPSLVGFFLSCEFTVKEKENYTHTTWILVCNVQLSDKSGET